MSAKILNIDDDKNCREVLSSFLKDLDFDVDEAEDARSALNMLKKNNYDIVITDKNMPYEAEQIDPDAGMIVLDYIAQHSPSTHVIMITGYASIETVIRAMKAGAFDFLTKPYALNDLQKTIERIIDYRSFINPYTTLNSYRSLYNAVYKALETKDDIHEAQREELKAIDQQVDSLFANQRRLEHIIIEKREVMAKIAMYAHILKEKLEDGDTTDFDSVIEQLLVLSEQRL